jgi:hypothetical protein
VNAWELQLDLVRWQFFCTFTMKDLNGKCPPLSHFIKGWYSLIRHVEKKLVYAPKSLLWVLRVEKGELTQRTHLHCLIAGLHRPHINKSTCFFLMDTWEKGCGGISRVRTWEPGLDAVSYITKPGNTYEQGKFGLQSCEVTLSPAADRFLKLRAKLSR